MRLAALLASVAIAAIHPALAADPPAAPATPVSETPAQVRSPVAAPAAEAPPATATATATATSASPAATAPAASAAPEDNDAAQLERRMRARGYTTHMENGEKVFCRREQVLGSRLGGAMHCMHPDEARANLIQNDEEQLRQRMMMGCVPSHTSNGTPVANCGG